MNFYIHGGGYLFFPGASSTSKKMGGEGSKFWLPMCQHFIGHSRVNILISGEYILSTIGGDISMGKYIYGMIIASSAMIMPVLRQ